MSKGNTKPALTVNRMKGFIDRVVSDRLAMKKRLTEADMEIWRDGSPALLSDLYIGSEQMIERETAMRKQAAMRIVADLPQNPEAALAILDTARQLVTWDAKPLSEPKTGGSPSPQSEAA